MFKKHFFVVFDVSVKFSEFCMTGFKQGYLTKNRLFYKGTHLIKKKEVENHSSLRRKHQN